MLTTCRTVAFAAIFLGWISGCRAEPATVDPALRALLAYYDKQYDSAEQMLCLEYQSRSNHSKTPFGKRIHPTRESVIYALALLQRGDVDDVERARAILRKILRLQDVDPASPTYGVWPWHVEEPLEEMPAPDFNWADFCGVQIAHMLAEHSDQLTPDLKRDMRQSLRHAAEAIRNRDVGPGYTNIAVLGGVVCATAGELLDDHELLGYGRRRLQKVVQHTAQHGSFNEYNSPPYLKVVIAECERTLALVEDPATRQAAESLRRTAWEIVADSFHPGTNQLAGPISRTSRDRLRAAWVDFFSRRIGFQIETHPSMIAGKPRGYAVVRPLPCPNEWVEKFRARGGAPRQLRRTFLRGKSEADSTIGTTWLAEDACLGSVNRSSFWTQRKPLIAFWRTEEDPAVVFRLRFLHDGKDFASMGFRTAQEGARTLSLIHSAPNRGDWHRTLDRPADGVFHAQDFRLRCELRGVGATADALDRGKYALSAGDRRMVIHTCPGRFAGNDVVWELGGDDQSVYLDGICYGGERRGFDFRAPVPIDLALGLELLRRDVPPVECSPEIKRMEGRVEAKWEIPGDETLAVQLLE